MLTTRARLLVFLVLIVSLTPFSLAQLTVTDDTYVTGVSPTQANGSSTALVVQGPLSNKPSLTYIRFDLSSLAGIQGSQIQKATLRLYVNAVTAAGGFDVKELSSPAGWAEGTLTYNSGGGTPVGTILATNVQVPYPASKYEYVLVDVTSALVDWLGTAPNNGLALIPNTTSISVSFSSKEDTTYSHEPSLIVIVKPGFGANSGVSSFKTRTGAVLPQDQDYTFGQIEQGQNTRALVIGPGGSLTTSGGGTIAATSVPGAGVTGSVANANHATNADNATNATNATHATNADNATHATSADSATSAAHASTADTATNAGHANTADSATNADHATNSDQLGGVAAASYARQDTANTFALGQKQTVQGNADYAGLNIAGFNNDPTNHPKTAGDLWFNNASNQLKFQDNNNTTRILAFTDSPLSGDGSGLTNLNASHLSSGTVPQGQLSGTYNISISGNASTADNATHATNADNATHATSADSATNANHANTADNATNAAHATLADTATLALSANTAAHADNADHATSADNAAHATNSDQLGGVAAASYARQDQANTFSATQALAPLTGGGAQASNRLQLNSTDGTTPQTAQLQARTDGGLSFQFGPTAGPIAEKASVDKNGVFTGDGSGLTNISGANVSNIDAGSITTGTLNIARIADGSIGNAKLTSNSVTVTAGTGLSGGGQVSLGNTVTLNNAGVLSVAGDGTVVTSTGGQNPIVAITGVVPVAHGGTGSMTQNFVDLTTDQANIAGNKTFTGLFTTADATINQATNNSNALFGKRATDTNPTGYFLLFQNMTAANDLFKVDVNGNVTAGKFTGDGSGLTGVTASNIADGTVTTSKIVDGAVTNAKLANSAVTVTAGTGLSGGGQVSLGSSVTLNNAGVLTVAGDGTVVTSTGGQNPIVAITGVVPVAHGGTGSATQNFVDLTTDQANIAGNKTFTGLFTTANATINQKADGDTLLFGKRASDSSPTGFLLRFQDMAGASDLFKVDVNGNATAVKFTGDGSGLTNISGANITNIPNSALQNSSVNINTGAGLSGGGNVALGGSLNLSNTGLLTLTPADTSIVTTGGQNPLISVGTITNSNIVDNSISPTKVTNTAAVLSGGNSFSGDQTVTGQLHATSSTADALVGTSTNNTGVSGSGAVGVVGTANGNIGSIGVRGDAAVVDGQKHIGVRGDAADPNSVAGEFESTGAGTADILHGLQNGTKVFSVAGNGDVTAHKFIGDGSGLTNISGANINNIDASSITSGTLNIARIADGSIGNAKLTFNSVTVNAGTGLSGGGSITLGGNTTLNNAGVLSNIAGTGISVSGATGNVTIANTGVLTVDGDGTTILNGGTAQNRTLSVGLIGGGQVVGNIAGNSANVTGVVAVPNGGTGITSGTSGGVPYFSASNTIASSAALSSGGLVLGGGAGNAPSTNGDFTTATVTNGAALNIGKSGSGSPNTGDLGSLFLGGSTSGGPTLASQAAGGSLTLQLPNTAPSANQVLTAAAVSGNNVTLGFSTPNGGTVTNIATSAPITGGPITSAGTISCPTCVTGGSLTSGQLIVGGGSQGVTVGNLTGDVSTSGGTATTLAASGVTAGTYTAPTLAVDAKGRVTSASTNALPTTESAPSHQFFNSYSSVTGIFGTAQPAFTDISGQAAEGQLPATTVFTDQTNTYTAGKKQTFVASATNAGFSFGTGVSADPSTPATGDLWYRSDSKRIQFFNGAATNPLATTAGTLTSGHCATFDANGNIVDNGAACNTGTVTSVTASSPLASSGGATPNISLTGIVGIGNGGTGASTASAALSNLGGATAVPGAGGTFTKITFNTQGIVTAGTTASAGDLSNGTSGSGAIVLATSPALAGTPTAPTAASGTNTTQIATTAFVQSAVTTTTAPTFIKDSSNGALPNNKISAWIGNNSTGDGAGTETQFEFLMGETVTYAKFFCKLSGNTAAGQTVTFQAFDSTGVAIVGLTCVIPANSSTGTATGTSITLSSNTLYAVKATASTGNMNTLTAWWAIGQ